MKLTYLTAGLLAALASAKPITEPGNSNIDYASGTVSGEAAPQLVTSPLDERALTKRANTQFTVYPSTGPPSLTSYPITSQLLTM